MSEIEIGSYKPKLEKINLIQNVLNPLYNEYKNTAFKKSLKFILETNCNENSSFLGDYYTITQIFDNLIDNAIKFSEKGTIKILVDENETHLIIDISDNGIGISDEFMPKLFKKFSQEEHGYTRSFDGNGLGLALVKKYCQLNNAQITVTSKKFEGSTFRIYLPKK